MGDRRIEGRAMTQRQTDQTTPYRSPPPVPVYVPPEQPTPNVAAMWAARVVLFGAFGSPIVAVVWHKLGALALLVYPAIAAMFAFVIGLVWLMGLAMDGGA